MILIFVITTYITYLLMFPAHWLGTHIHMLTVSNHLVLYSVLFVRRHDGLFTFMGYRTDRWNSNLDVISGLSQYYWSSLR